MARIGQDKDLSGNDVSLLIEVLFLVVFSEPVWNLGDSYFVRGKERARKTEGLNMGLRGVEVRWLGLTHFSWEGNRKLYYMDILPLEPLYRTQGTLEPLVQTQYIEYMIDFVFPIRCDFFEFSPSVHL